jgi:hypothetical protein
MAPSAFDKALSTLESEISVIERYVDGLEVWLWVSSIAVIIGVAFELYFVLREHREDMEAWSRGIVRPPDKPYLRILVAEIASVALVVFGVTGELAVGILSSNANAKLRGKNSERIQLVREKAGAAEIEAGKAKQTASEAIERAAKINEQAEELRSANLELERELSPRVLSGKAQQDLSILLKPFAPIATSLQYLQGDDDARRLSEELILPLSLAWGTTSAVPKVSILDGISTFGVLIGFNMFGLSRTDANRLQGAAESLARRLNEDGIRAISNPMMNPNLRDNPPGLLVVWIGLKPNPIEDKRFIEILEKEPEPFRSTQIRKWFPDRRRVK